MTTSPLLVSRAAAAAITSSSSWLQRRSLFLHPGASARSPVSIISAAMARYSRMSSSSLSSSSLSSFFTTTTTTTSKVSILTSTTTAAAATATTANNNNNNSNGMMIPIIVKVADGGSSITLGFQQQQQQQQQQHDNHNRNHNRNHNNHHHHHHDTATAPAIMKVEEESTFHASWLWSNDPRRVLLPSGQRSSTPGSWCIHRQTIGDAQIIYCDIHSSGGGGGSNGGGDSSQVSKRDGILTVPGPTCRDSCHPLPIYGKYPSWMSTTTSSTTADATATDIDIDFDFDIETNNKSFRPYLQITWSPLPPSEKNTIHPNNNTITTTTSFYDMEWLQRFRYDDASRLGGRKKETEVQPVHAIQRNNGHDNISSSGGSSSSSANNQRRMTKRGNDGLVHVDYHSIIGSEDGGGGGGDDGDDDAITNKGLWTLLEAVFRDGAAIVSNTPLLSIHENNNNGNNNNNNNNNFELSLANENDESLLPVAKLAKAMSGGSLSHGALYGNIFHVRVGERNSNNVAYTSAPLCPHQDLAYYESPPGMQLLHCLAMGKGVVGGESTLIDAMAAAYRLREVRPESFECLVKCPATFVKQRVGASMTYQRPHIVLAEEGYERKNSMNREIVAVHWSPPFEGPLSLPPEDVDRYYEAYADFERMLDVSVDAPLGCETDSLSQYAIDYTWERKLSPGEVLVFNNRRMLHGRRGFSAAEGLSLEDSQRHLVGCYTNIDDTLNSYRVLLREMLLHENENRTSLSILNVGNGTNNFP